MRDFTSTRLTRSWLFTPGNRPDRFAKAAAVGADVLIIDLEDAVAADQKHQARVETLSYLASRPAGEVATAVRVNGLDTVEGLADLQAIVTAGPNIDFIVLPKTESADHILILDRLLARAGLPARIVGLVESARGLAAVESIAAASPRLHGLMFGAADMAADLRARVAWESLYHVRGRMIASCANAGIHAIDTPWFDIRDEAGLAAEVERGVAMGFSAKAAIHPHQVGTINAALTPRPEEIERARAILLENEKGVGLVDGKMIDEAVARQARRIIAAAGKA